jgi:hypothetical protein
VWDSYVQAVSGPKAISIDSSCNGKYVSAMPVNVMGAGCCQTIRDVIDHCGTDCMLLYGTDLGSPPGPTLDTFFNFSVIRGGKMVDCFQVHAFCGPGMEMMPEWSGCMCHNQNKNNVF